MKTCLPLLIFYGLSVYRLAVLFSQDQGPFHFISRLRSWLHRKEKKYPLVKKADPTKAVECIRCNSVHIAAPVSLFAYFHRQIPDWIAMTGDIFLGAMALSALAIIANRAFPPKD